MKRLVVTIVAVIFVAATATVAFSGAGWRGHDRGPCFERDDISRLSPELNLTAEQTAKIKALREAQMKESKPLLDQQFIKRGDLKLLWMQDNPDAEKIKTLHREVRQLRDQLEDKEIAYWQEVNKILTPEQRSTFKTRFPGGGFCPGGDGPGMGMGRGGMRGDHHR